MRVYRRFWSAIAITSGLTITLFGASFYFIEPRIGLFDIVFGVFILIIGFCIAPWKEPHDQNLKAVEKEQETKVNYTKEDYKVYQEERKFIASGLREQARSFDKYVLTLAAGSFGLSFLFIRYIAPEPQPHTLNFLIAAWSCFGTSILFTLISFLFSQISLIRQLKLLDKWLEQGGHNGYNVFTIIIHVLNWLSMIAFLSGVVLLIIFSIQNLLATGRT